ncbi:MAG: lipid-A-disaccharide synthase [Flavobacteriaceae bacterium]|nr:lipid-A-disaccharide synthase [Flavobacteriaceae bacterium]
MKYYIIAGEASGDLHGSNLIKELKKLDKNYSFRCWGGDLMNEQTNNLAKHHKDYSYMGFLEVFLNLYTIIKNISFCKSDILKYNPDIIIYIDFPGFNLRIAEWAKKNGFKNHYYISPQIWAWKESRIKLIKKVVDKMYVILPFEKKFYKEKHNFDVSFVGHPLMDEISEDTSKLSQKTSKDKTILLLPGSRDQEIKKLLPIMLSVASEFKDYKFIIGAAPSQKLSIYQDYVKDSNVKIIQNKTYELLKNCTAAIVTSGTATLETALFKVPQIVCYKSSWTTYLIGKILLKNLNYISLVNLIANKLIVKELIQNACSKKNLIKELNIILEKKERAKIISNYNKLENNLGGRGASNKTAVIIYNYLVEENSETKDS